MSLQEKKAEHLIFSSWCEHVAFAPILNVLAIMSLKSFKLFSLFGLFGTCNGGFENLNLNELGFKVQEKNTISSLEIHTDRNHGLQ